MKAIRIHAHGAPEVMRWEDVDLPPPGDGEARVRHTAIAVNFSDINVRRGGFYSAAPAPMPLIPGNEAAGVEEDMNRLRNDVGQDKVIDRCCHHDLEPPCASKLLSKHSLDTTRGSFCFCTVRNPG